MWTVRIGCKKSCTARRKHEYVKKTAADAKRPPLSLWGEKGMVMYGLYMELRFGVQRGLRAGGKLVFPYRYHLPDFLVTSLYA